MDIFDNAPLEFINYGPLNHPITSQKVELIKNTHLELITQYPQRGAISNSVKYPPGTIKQNNETVILKSHGDIEIKLIGVQPYQKTESYNHIEQTNTFIEKSKVHQIYKYIKKQSQNDSQIEYLSNINNDYLFSDYLIKHTILNINYSINKFNINQNKTSFNSDGNAIEIIIQDIKLYFICLKKNECINDAVIIYEKVQSEEVRRKIRNCLSFCLGRQLQYMGYLIIDNENRPVEYFYQSNYSKVNLNSYITLMPTPLSQYRNKIERDTINKLINALFNSYDKYNLQHVLWIYFHALDAPLHIAGAHFGACIESFQSAYIAAHSDVFSSKLIEKNKWKSLKYQLTEILDNSDISEPELSIFKNKIEQLNQTPKSILTKRFFEHINININTIEISAWKERNNAAHGKYSDEIIVQIKQIRILRCLLHRILLKATNGSDFYFDYYSIGFPIREISTSIGTEN